MDDKTIFYTLLALFLYYRCNEIQKLLDIGFNFVLNFLNNDVFVDFDQTITDSTIILEKEEKPVIKYEDKFLNDIRKMEKEYIFNEAETQLLEEKTASFYKQIIETRENIEKNKNKLCEIEFIYSKLKHEIELEREIELEKEYNSDEKITNIEKLENLLSDKERLCFEIRKLESTINHENDIEEANIQARNFIINKRIEKLENCFIMENTPQGNVLMIYDNKRNSFKFYSDNNIPYRYLEVVGRKYVKMFDCRPLYVDMEEELNLAEERWEKEREKEREEKERKEKEEKKEQEKKQRNVSVEKKSVFAKFKSYNKEGASGRVNIGVPPKNSIPMTKEQENEKILLKEKANRYTYEGKIANFSFLKKVERKVVDKKYGLSFADFKKMQKSAK